MQELRLGEVVRRRREELNISQEALCEGLCDRTSLSRFENGQQTLSRKRVVALFQRLGLPDDRFYALLSQDELALEEAEREVRHASVRLERSPKAEQPGLWVLFREKMETLEALAPDDPFVRQCSLSVRAMQGTEDGPYGFEERLRMQLEAIRCTSPQFKLECVGRGSYSTEELRIIMQIAMTYSTAEQYEEAVRIYCMVLEYLEANGQKLSHYSYFKASYTANCSNALCRLGRYKEALDMAETGILVSLEERRYHVLSTLLWVQAYCYYHLGERERSVKLYRQVYYLLLSIREVGQLQSLQEQIKELLGIEFTE